MKVRGERGNAFDSIMVSVLTYFSDKLSLMLLYATVFRANLVLHKSYSVL